MELVPKIFTIVTGLDKHMVFSGHWLPRVEPVTMRELSIITKAEPKKQFIGMKLLCFINNKQADVLFIPDTAFERVVSKPEYGEHYFAYIHCNTAFCDIVPSFKFVLPSLEFRCAAAVEPEKKLFDL